MSFVGRKPNEPRRDGGFTLIEVLIAMLVLVSGMVSVLALFTHSVTIHRTAVDEARAATAIEMVLDRLQVAWDETGSEAALQATAFEDAQFAPFRIATTTSPLPAFSVSWRATSTA